MSGLIEALIYIIQTLGSLYLLIVLLRRGGNGGGCGVGSVLGHVNLIIIDLFGAERRPGAFRRVHDVGHRRARTSREELFRKQA